MGLVCSALRQARFISLGLHLSHGEVLFSPVWHFRAFTPSVFPCLLPGLFLRLWPFAACLLTLPAFWYPLCLLPAPTIALPLLINLLCLRYTCSCYRTLPVWPPLVFILIKLHLDLNATDPFDYRIYILYILNIHICKYPNTHTYRVCVWFITDREILPEFMIKKNIFEIELYFWTHLGIFKKTMHWNFSSWILGVRSVPSHCQ